MQRTLLLTGDVNLMNVADANVPFARVASALRGAAVLFGNLECCLYDPPAERSLEDEGFYAPIAAGQALKLAGYSAVGTANNVNYGAAAVCSSLEQLDRLGIAHTGSGATREAAYRPAVVGHQGLRFGFLQRTSVYWPTNHEAAGRSPGVAVIRGHTAYQVPAHRTRPEIPPANRPGVPPVIVTWADAEYLARFREDVAALRHAADVVVCSHHWGLHQEVLQYMTEIAHAAIDTGADIVLGHGPHLPLGIELYQGKPIFYGLGNFSFHTGHGARKHGDWVGIVAKIVLDERAIRRITFRLVRHNERNETYFCALEDESATLDELRQLSVRYRTTIEVGGEEAVVSSHDSRFSRQ